jgi:hypothetical protein
MKIQPNAVRRCSTFLLALLLISLPSPLRNALPYFQPTFTRRTTGHCLGTYIAQISLPPPQLNTVSITTLPPFYHFSDIYSASKF